MEIAKAICGYVSRNFDYDWIKAGTIRSGRTKGMLPDIGKTWETKKGICQDLSAVLCAMLRSQGIPAKLAIGSADGSYHSWVVIIIDGKTKRFDPSFSARSYKAERYY
jgi:transglutaminase-like putative cysteine protease